MTPENKSDNEGKDKHGSSKIAVLLVLLALVISGAVAIGFILLHQRITALENELKQVKKTCSTEKQEGRSWNLYTTVTAEVVLLVLFSAALLSIAEEKNLLNITSYLVHGRGVMAVLSHFPMIQLCFQWKKTKRQCMQD